MKTYEQYEHHGKLVWVNKDIRGTHRDYCLCFSCSLFHPNTPDNCKIAQELYELDVQHNLTTPVFECPIFNELKG